MKPIAPLALLFTIVALSFAAATTPASAAPRQGQQPAISVTAVSRPHDNLWTVTLSTGITLRVEIRVLDTGGQPPQVGKAISAFRDQGWLPILGYYGYATFQQGTTTYHAYR